MLLTGKLLLIFTIMIVKVRKVQAIATRSIFRKTLVLLLLAAPCWITVGCLQTDDLHDLGRDKVGKKVIQLCYEILGVDRNASPKAIKKARKGLVLIYHPDKGGNKKAFEAIQGAYEILEIYLKKEKTEEDTKYLEERLKSENVKQMLEDALKLKESGSTEPSQPVSENVEESVMEPSQPVSENVEESVIEPSQPVGENVEESAINDVD
jgi:DnaJ domain